MPSVQFFPKENLRFPTLGKLYTKSFFSFVILTLASPVSSFTSVKQVIKESEDQDAGSYIHMNPKEIEEARKADMVRKWGWVGWWQETKNQSVVHWPLLLFSKGG